MTRPDVAPKNYPVLGNLLSMVSDVYIHYHSELILHDFRREIRVVIGNCPKCFSAGPICIKCQMCQQSNYCLLLRNLPKSDSCDYPHPILLAHHAGKQSALPLTKNALKECATRQSNAIRWDTTEFNTDNEWKFSLNAPEKRHIFSYEEMCVKCNFPYDSQRIGAVATEEEKEKWKTEIQIDRSVHNDFPPLAPYIVTNEVRPAPTTEDPGGLLAWQFIHEPDVPTGWENFERFVALRTRIPENPNYFR